MGDAEIRADLRLQLDKLGADTAKAAKMINKDLASSVKGLGETSVERDQRLADDRAARARRERAIRNRKLDEADERKEERRKAAQQNSMRYDRSVFERQMMAGMLPMFRPFSPWGTFFAGRQAFQAFSGTKTGRNMMGQFGLSGNGGAAIATAAFVAGATAIGTAVLAFREAVSNFSRSVDQAREMYAATLRSGYGLQTGYKLQTAGRVIGVDPNTVWQFGAAFSQVAPRLKEATEVLSQTNPVLTQTSWEFGILKTDMEALWASISKDAAPAVNAFIKSLDGLVKWFIEHESIRQNIEKVVTTGWMLNAGPIGWYAKLFLNDKKNRASLGLDEQAKSAPPPVAYMRQLPASRWEHMGLIVGAGGGTNYAKNTAENTKKALQYLADIPKFLTAIQRLGAGNPLGALAAFNNTP